MGLRPRDVRLDDLVAGLPGLRLVGDPTVTVSSVTSDSRDVVPGSLFVAVRSRTIDGHAFVPEAVSRGARAVLAERPVEVGVPTVVAVDSRRAHAAVAAAFHGRPSARLRVVGVTGTDGKTTTSHLLDHTLRRAGRRTGRIGSLGVAIAGTPVPGRSTLTTPLASDVQSYLHRMVEEGVADAVVEASSVGLSEHRLDAVDFAAVAVTNLTPEHLEQHGGMDAYRAAKAGLVDRVAADGGVIAVNLDDPGARSLATRASGGALVGFAVDEPTATVRATSVETTAHGNRFVLRTPFGNAEVDLPLPGPFNVSNALCAAAAALGLGVDLDCVVSSLHAAPSVPGRMVRIDEGQPFDVYVDYAHTLAGITAVLTHLRAQHPAGRLIAVSGTGLVRDYGKRPEVGRTLVGLADLTVLTAGDAPYEAPHVVVGHYAAGARAAGGESGRDFWCVPDREEAIGVAIAVAAPGDVVAVLGKGHEAAVTVLGERRPWSDEAVVRAALQAVAGRRR